MKAVSVGAAPSFPFDDKRSNVPEKKKKTHNDMLSQYDWEKNF